MAIENKEYSANDLEHVKFTPESTKENSVVQVRVDTEASPVSTEITKLTDEQIRETDRILCLLEQLLDESRKTNIYLAMITDNKI